MELAGRRNEKVKELQAKLWKTTFFLAPPSPSGKEKAESVSEFCAIIGSVRLVLAEWRLRYLCKGKLLITPFENVSAKPLVTWERERSSYRTLLFSILTAQACRDILEARNNQEVRGRHGRVFTYEVSWTWRNIFTDICRQRKPRKRGYWGYMTQRMLGWRLIYNNVESLTDDNGWQENKKGGILIVWEYHRVSVLTKSSSIFCCRARSLWPSCWLHQLCFGWNRHKLV